MYFGLVNFRDCLKWPRQDKLCRWKPAPIQILSIRDYTCNWAWELEFKVYIQMIFYGFQIVGYYLIGINSYGPVSFTILNGFLLGALKRTTTIIESHTNFIQLSYMFGLQLYLMSKPWKLFALKLWLRVTLFEEESSSISSLLSNPFL